MGNRDNAIWRSTGNKEQGAAWLKENAGILNIEPGEPVERLQPNINSPLSTSKESSNRNQWIFKMPNKTQQKLYFATILDLEHHRTPPTTELHISVN